MAWSRRSGGEPSSSQLCHDAATHAPLRIKAARKRNHAALACAPRRSQSQGGTHRQDHSGVNFPGALKADETSVCSYSAKESKKEKTLVTFPAYAFIM